FEAPLLGGDAVRGCEQRFGVDRPAVNAVHRSCDGQMGDPSQVFDTREQDRAAVEGGGCWVEDGVDRIGPILRGQDRIGGVPDEELPRHQATASSRTPERTPAASSTSAARWKARVD